MLIGLGGMLGTLLRYFVSGLAHRLYGGTFPLGTLTVNAVGCFLIGIVMSLVEHRQALGPDVRAFVIVGILGGFTTFSAFGYETWDLLRRGAPHLAVLNAGANVVIGIVAVGLGMASARAL